MYPLKSLARWKLDVAIEIIYQEYCINTDVCFALELFDYMWFQKEIVFDLFLFSNWYNC